MDGKGKQSEYYFKFDTDKDLTYGLVADDGQGLMGQQKDVLPVKNGYAQITEHLFDRDALIVEDRQASAVSLCTPDKKPYVTLALMLRYLVCGLPREGSTVYLYRALVWQMRQDDL